MVTVQPIPIAVSMEGGVVSATGAVNPVGEPPLSGFPLLLDTGSAVTAFDPTWQGAPQEPVGAGHGVVRLLSADSATPRLQIDDVLLYRTPLLQVGAEGALFPGGGNLGGVLGGDNLARFAVAFDLRTPAEITFLPSVTTCGCDLADSCQAVFPFTLGGGATQVAVGSDVFSVPPTRVVLDACLEPLVDPVSRDVACIDCNTQAMNPAYLPSGIDVKLVVATGFPGLALGSTAYDRLRGQGAAKALLAASSAHVELPSGEQLLVAQDQLGQSAASALALVSREIYFGPCDELARSRRLRRVPPGANLSGSPRACEATCLLGADATGDVASRMVKSCLQQSPSTDICDDGSQSARAAAVVEWTAPMPVKVIDAASSLLTAVNEDLRPNIVGADPGPVVEGVIGAGALARLVATLDYPNKRMIARCSESSDCVAYPRFWNGSECSRTCTAIQTTFPPGRQRSGNDVGTPGSEQLPPSPLPGALCPPAEPR